ncbi:MULTISPECIES: GNAT family N-acetyltransferase [Streptosporangium]|uniref:GNAT superfamily N-acetyltransferase n=1 Tax=Streptosporangium brasiliense TaxID=47480 RepID=A0ABT9RJ22_9ACTN|nr:GNAT family N-acetyltransferase [Streptosporangium brasiliense]MDP9868806.1 GNAT superfamily N-acetyltransferase [Streptosporangium brasiliense]
MHLVVVKGPDKWTVWNGEALWGEASMLLRPDGRHFVFFRSCRAEAYGPPVHAAAEHHPHDLCTELSESDVDSRRHLAEAGFTIARTEHVYTLSTDPHVTGLSSTAAPAGFTIVTADQVPEKGLRELDDELRQDVPGCAGWKWDRQEFRRQTYDSPDFDPATYLVAVDQSTGRYAGLARVWGSLSMPRLGLITVGRPYRRLGLARALLARVFGLLHQRGKTSVIAEVDATNLGSTTLLSEIGARRVGGSIELIRPNALGPVPTENHGLRRQRAEG